MGKDRAGGGAVRPGAEPGNQGQPCPDYLLSGADDPALCRDDDCLGAVEAARPLERVFHRLGAPPCSRRTRHCDQCQQTPADQRLQARFHAWRHRADSARRRQPVAGRHVARRHDPLLLWMDGAAEPLHPGLERRRQRGAHLPGEFQGRGGLERCPDGRLCRSGHADGLFLRRGGVADPPGIRQRNRQGGAFLYGGTDVLGTAGRHQGPDVYGLHHGFPLRARPLPLRRQGALVAAGRDGDGRVPVHRLQGRRQLFLRRPALGLGLVADVR